MSLLSDTDATVWLAADVVITLIVAYTGLYLLYTRVCRLDPSRAIRWALTTGFLILIIMLSTASAPHAHYLAFWNDSSLFPNFLFVTVPIAIFLAFVWGTRPGAKAK